MPEAHLLKALKKSNKNEKRELGSMEVVNPNAAGIDIGSRSHWVTVGQPDKNIREFGVYNEDLYKLVEWLKEEKVRTIAMESTGTYWQTLHAILIKNGFDVILCDGKFTKNIKGKKQILKIVHGSKNCIPWDY